MRRKDVLGFLRSLLFPPCCVSCGKRLPFTPGCPAPVLCPGCRQALSREQVAFCPVCRLELRNCRCQPGLMEKAGAAGLLKLAFYSPDEAPALRRILLRAKEHRLDRVFTCLSTELSPVIEQFLAEDKNKNPDVPPFVLTYLPRSRENRCLYGFDQTAELSALLGKRLNLTCRSFLVRAKETGQQKKLNRMQRRRNVRGVFRVCGEVCGARILLLDDLVTTGASMAEAARTLLHAGAAEVVGVCVAVVPPKADPKKTFLQGL